MSLEDLERYLQLDEPSESDNYEIDSVKSSSSSNIPRELNEQ